MKSQNMRATKRRWFKLYPTECINGSIRWQLTPSQRGVWYDLLAFSALCSNTGDICDRDEKPYPHSFIANRLNIDSRLLEATISKCIDEGRITEDDYGIHITNWKLYQSEYDRQKPYREAKRKYDRAVDYLRNAPKNKDGIPILSSQDEREMLDVNQEYLEEHPEKITGYLDEESYDLDEVYSEDD